MTQGSDVKALDKAITERFTEEVQRTALPVSEVARRMGESSHQRVRDVMRGKQRLPADMLAKAALIGFDVNYILTGTPPQLSHKETAILNNYRAASSEGRDHLEAAYAAAAEPSKPQLIQP